MLRDAGRDDVQFLIVGDGARKDELADLARSRKLDNVRFTAGRRNVQRRGAGLLHQRKIGVPAASASSSAFCIRPDAVTRVLVARNCPTVRVPSGAVYSLSGSRLRSTTRPSFSKLWLSVPRIKPSQLR